LGRWHTGIGIAETIISRDRHQEHRDLGGMARTIGANRDQRPARLEKAAGAIGITRLSRQRRAASNGATATPL
jgi:hypothetical protein